MRRFALAASTALGLAAAGLGCSATPTADPEIASQPFAVPSNGLGQRGMGAEEPTGVSGWLASTGKAIGDAITIDETVIPAEDGVDLNSKPQVTPSLHLAQAQFMERKGDVDGAMAQYDAALKLDEKFAPAKLALARLLDRSGKADEAEMRYRELTVDTPQNPVAFNDLGLFQARRGKLEPARESLEEAVRLEPKSPLYRNNLATVYVELGQPIAAAERLEPVFGKAVASYNVAYLLKERGQYAPARDWAAHASRLDPALTPAHELAAESDRMLRVAAGPAATTR